ncbi:MAG TPA: ECF-type sigma factor [Pirellulaceae bacterium]|jgi:hypothetical protein
MSDVTQILSQIEQGEAGAAERLLPFVYEELRKLAAAKLAGENPGQTLQATALVHEAYLRLVGGGGTRDSGLGVEGRDSKPLPLVPNPDPRTPIFDRRGHFFAAAAEAMRRILVEQARRKAGPRMGGGWRRQDADLDVAGDDKLPDEVLEIDEALKKLAVENAAVARFVELKYFAGLKLEEAADAMSISTRTATRYWTYAKAWLMEELRHD